MAYALSFGHVRLLTPTVRWADIVERAAVGCHYLLQGAGPCLWQRMVQQSYCVLVRDVKALNLEPPEL
jgi:hypothetical protein